MIEASRIHDAAPRPLDLARMLGLQASRTSRPDRALVLCPWHSEKNPSCTIVVRDGRIVAYCQSCRSGGDVFSLVAVVNGLDTRVHFPDVLAKAAELFGVYDLGGDVEPKPQRERRPSEDAVQLAAEIDQAAEDWLAGRPVRDYPAIAQADPGDILHAIRVGVDADIAATKRRMAETTISDAESRRRDEALERMEVPAWAPNRRP